MTEIAVSEFRSVVYATQRLSQESYASFAAHRCRPQACGLLPRPPL